ncbi:hypothetical protein P609_23575 [Comamonas thiooxydans]|nr:hypothetical protein P609_23575 [Comamonas thiooxydans]
MATARAMTVLSTQSPILGKQILLRRRSADLASLCLVYGEPVVWCTALVRSRRSHGAGAATQQQPAAAMLCIQKLLAPDCIRISNAL